MSSFLDRDVSVVDTPLIGGNHHSRRLSSQTMAFESTSAAAATSASAAAAETNFAAIPNAGNTWLKAPSRFQRMTEQYAAVFVGVFVALVVIVLIATMAALVTFTASRWSITISCFSADMHILISKDDLPTRSIFQRIYVRNATHWIKVTTNGTLSEGDAWLEVQEGKVTTLVELFFGRKVCSKVPTMAEVAAYNPVIHVDGSWSSIGRSACPGNESISCDVWHKTSVVTEKGTRVPVAEQYFLSGQRPYRYTSTTRSSSITIDFLSFSRKEPDPSIFVPPNVTCVDLTGSTKAHQEPSTRGWERGANSLVIGRMLDFARRAPAKPGRWTAYEPPAAEKGNELPASYDVRNAWPACKKSLEQIFDQRDCNCGYAIAPLSVLSNRICMATNGTRRLHLSPQWVISCDTGQLGCTTGWTDVTWRMLADHGIPEEECVRYWAEDLKCPAGCDFDDSELRLTRASKVYSVFVPGGTIADSAAAIQREILERGPVVATFWLFEDLIRYSGGVYTRNGTKVLSTSWAKIIGWGTDDHTGVPFWTCVQSWDSMWGERGFFRIRRGSNEVGIEDRVSAGMP